MKKGFFSSSTSYKKPEKSLQVVSAKLSEANPAPYKFYSHPDSDESVFILKPALVSKLEKLKPPAPKTHLATYTHAGNEVPLFRIVKHPTHGMAVYAARPIKANEIIFSEYPLIILPPDAADTFKPAVFDTMLEKLNPVSRAAFMDLSGVFAGHLPTSILRTNGTPLVVLSGESYSGVFEMWSRVNHSCDPNVVLVWDEDSWTGVCRARRDIAEGDELLGSWIMTMQKRQQRKAELQLRYKFDCDCVWCTLSDDESAKKDAEREAMAQAFLKQYA